MILINHGLTRASVNACSFKKPKGEKNECSPQLSPTIRKALSFSLTHTHSRHPPSLQVLFTAALSSQDPSCLGGKEREILTSGNAQQSQDLKDCTPRRSHNGSLRISKLRQDGALKAHLKYVPSLPPPPPVCFLSWYKMRDNYAKQPLHQHPHTLKEVESKQASWLGKKKQQQQLPKEVQMKIHIKKSTGGLRRGLKKRRHPSTSKFHSKS